MPASKPSRQPATRTRTARAGGADPAGSSAATDSRRAQSAALLDALRAVSRELRMSGREAEQRLGIHPAQLHALQQLADRPCRSLAELAERTHTDPSSVSVVVQRLVDDGLVARTVASDDRRRTELSITSAGRMRLRREPAPVERRLDDAVATLGEQRAALVARGLQVLANALRPQGPATNGAERPARRSAGAAGR
jgi:DNA-binding MarR family transcriptional regulator